MIENIIIISVLVLIIGAVSFYIIKRKRKGKSVSVALIRKTAKETVNRKT